MGFVSTAKRLVPASIRRAIKGAPPEGGLEADLGTFVLAEAEALARQTGGDPSALSRPVVVETLRNRTAIKRASEAQQFLMTAFQPHYEQNLFPYYQQQQFPMLLAFLSYPFRGPGGLNAQILPYEAAADALPELDILDYGAGVPYGLIHLLRTRPERVRSVTLVDLDLIHTRLTESIVRGFIGDRLTMIRNTDPNALPDFKSRTFNFCFGKDIFEHLTDPSTHLAHILASAAPNAICYFDFTDHGEKYLQHVSPHLSPLNALVEERGFAPLGMLAAMTGYRRSAV